MEPLEDRMRQAADRALADGLISHYELRQTPGPNPFPLLVLTMAREVADRPGMLDRFGGPVLVVDPAEVRRAWGPAHPTVVLGELARGCSRCPYTP